MELIKKLNKIQQELEAPKNQVNAFGHYNYRSCEDILKAVKPLLDGAVIILADEIVNVGDRYYVKATVTISDKNENIRATAYARESLDKKGMDTAQITGSTSSYARKYALNGLLCIDDTKDADTMNNTKIIDNTLQTQKPIHKPKPAPTNYNNAVTGNKEDKDWITDALFKEAISTMVENGTIKMGEDTKSVMKFLRMKYAVAKKYEAIVDQEINNCVIK